MYCKTPIFLNKAPRGYSRNAFIVLFGRKQGHTRDKTRSIPSAIIVPFYSYCRRSQSSRGAQLVPRTLVIWRMMLETPSQRSQRILLTGKHNKYMSSIE